MFPYVPCGTLECSFRLLHYIPSCVIYLSSSFTALSRTVAPIIYTLDPRLLSSRPILHSFIIVQRISHLVGSSSSLVTLPYKNIAYIIVYAYLSPITAQ